MNTPRRFLVFVIGAVSSAVVSAQTIEFVSVVRQANYVQNGSLVTDRVADPTTPFVFRASIEGDSGTTSTNPLTAATFTRPGGSATALTFDASDHRWTYTDTTQTSMANLNTAYGTGSYAFNPTGTPNTTANVTVGSFASSLLAVPVMSLSGGTWVGGSYVIDRSATLSVSFNSVFSGTPGATDSFHFDTSLYGSTSINGVNDFVNWDAIANATAAYASAPPVFTVGAGLLTAGTYTIEANYDDIQNPAAVYGTAFSASLLEYRTIINLTVVPEPSAYAAALGGLALIGALWQRRRARAVA